MPPNFCRIRPGSTKAFRPFSICLCQNSRNPSKRLPSRSFFRLRLSGPRTTRAHDLLWAFFAGGTDPGRHPGRLPLALLGRFIRRRNATQIRHRSRTSRCSDPSLRSGASQGDPRFGRYCPQRGTLGYAGHPQGQLDSGSDSQPSRLRLVLSADGHERGGINRRFARSAHGSAPAAGSSDTAR